MWGSERVRTDKTLLAVALQPTPHGGRTTENAWFSFNSRPREGANIGARCPSPALPNFNSRPVWGELHCLFNSPKKLSYNSRPPCVGEPDSWAPPMIIAELQLTPPCGGERGRETVLYGAESLQLTPPRGGRTSLDSCYAETLPLQLTPRVGGEPLMVDSISVAPGASTHAPRVGANVGQNVLRTGFRALNSRPPRGDAHGDFIVPVSLTYCNSLPERGERRICAVKKGISNTTTHAPVWGRTSICCIRAPNTSSSNSRPRVGTNNWGDSCRNITIAPTCAPGGTNEKEAIRISQRSELQLPPLAGGEPVASLTSTVQGILQLTPPCGGEPFCALPRPYFFQAPTHAPVWGRTAVVPISLFAEKLQPTPPRGGERDWGRRTDADTYFNSRPVRGELHSSAYCF